MSLPKEPLSKEYDTTAIDNEAIAAMEKTQASCSRFRILYMGYQLRENTPQPDEAMAQVVSTMTKLWEIHKQQCSLGNDVSALMNHFKQSGTSTTSTPGL